MQGREDKVAGKRRFNGDHARYSVSDFTDHDDVRVLTEHTAQSGGKGEPGPRVHADLRQALKLVFYRVFDGENILLGAVQLRKHGVESCRFTRSGGARDQYNSVRPLDEELEL